MPQSVEKIGYTHEEYIEAFERAFLTFKFQRVYCPRKKKLVSMNSFEERDIFSEADYKSFGASVDIHQLNKNCMKLDYRALILKYSLKPEGLSFLGPILPHDLVVKIGNCEYDPITKQKFKREDHSDILITDRKFDDLKALAQRTLKQYNFTPLYPTSFSARSQPLPALNKNQEQDSKDSRRALPSDNDGNVNSSKSLKDCFANSHSNAGKIFERFNPNSQSQSAQENSSSSRLNTQLESRRQFGANFLPNNTQKDPEDEIEQEFSRLPTGPSQYLFRPNKMDEETPSAEKHSAVQPVVFQMTEQPSQTTNLFGGFRKAFQQKYKQLEEEEQQRDENDTLNNHIRPSANKMDVEYNRPQGGHPDDKEDLSEEEGRTSTEGSKLFKSNNMTKFTEVIDMLKVENRPSITKQTIGNFRSSYIQSYKMYSRQQPNPQQ